MSEEIKNKVVPKLRFPEFKNSGEWEEKKLGEIADIKRGAASQHLKYLTDSVNGVRLLRINDFLSNSPVYVEDTEEMKRYRVKTNDLLIAGTGATAGITFIVPEEFNGLAYSYNAPRIRVKQGDTYFIYTYLKSDNILQQQKKLFVGNAQPFLDTRAIANFRMSIPSKKEQQKIADCLSSLDELIGAENSRLEALKAHKKGLMQQLFPAEGETVPRLRFPEFRDSGEWEEKPLGKVAEIITGNTPPTNDASNYGGDKLFVSPSDISENRYITKTKTTLSNKGYSITRRIKANSVLFVCIGSTIGKVAQNKYECSTNQQINSLIPYKGYSSNFLYSVLELHASRISIIAGIQAVPIINKSLFSSIKTSFPCLDEQQKIAECLTALDERITAQAQKIEALKLHKKGLMQGLFPKTS